MRIAVTGASGWIGTAFQAAANERGWSVIPITRKPSSGAILWDAETRFAEPDALEGLDAVLHLAGESVFGFWTPAKQQRIRNSRVQSSALLARTLAACRRPPPVFVSVSAVGYYGNTGEKWVGAGHPPGDTFFARVCRDWEAAAEPAQQVGIRVTHPRFGIVLDADGGALQTMARLTKWGLGAVFGTGEQWWSWVSKADAVEALCWAIETPSVIGSWNLVSPDPVRQGDFARRLAESLDRPCPWRLPRPLLRLATDGLADSLLLCSCRAQTHLMPPKSPCWKLPTFERVLEMTSFV